MAAASTESCRFVALRSLRGRTGSVLVTCNRLRRMRRRFHQEIHISNLHGSARPSSTSPQSFGSRAIWRAPSASACGVGGYPLSELPRRSPRADLHPKKVNNLGPMAPRSRKKRNYPRAASSRRSGLVGPHTTPAIVNYKYMTSTL